MAFVAEQFIPRTPHEIWSIVTDWAVADYWLGVSQLRPLERNKRVKKGSKLMFRVRGRDHVTLVTHFEAPRKLSLSSTQGGITAHYEYTFESAEGGTRARLAARCSAESRWWKLLVPLVSWLMALTDKKQLQALEKLVRITTGSGK